VRVFKRGGTWYGLFYESGVRVQRSTRCQDKKAAEAVVREWERSASDPNHAAAHSATLGQALELLIKSKHEEVLAHRKSAGTVNFYLTKAGHVLRVLGEGFPLARLDGAAVDAFVGQRRAEGASEHTISKELIALRSALKLAKRRNLWRGDVGEVMPVGFAPEYKPKSRFLSFEEAQRLLAELTPDRAARVAFTIAVAATWSDTDRATRYDVSPDLSEVRVRGEKTAYRARTVPIVARWQRSLLEHALKHAQGAEGRLFTSWRNVRRDLHEACERAKIPPCSPNDLRRTCATWLRSEGVEADLIGSVLGHADSRMVERVYGRLSPEILRARLEKSLGLDCSTGATDRVDSAASIGLPGRSRPDSPSTNPMISVPRGGIEPPTRGFSVLCSTD